MPEVNVHKKYIGKQTIATIVKSEGLKKCQYISSFFQKDA
jgi:hypothetical protein